MRLLCKNSEATLSEVTGNIDSDRNCANLKNTDGNEPNVERIGDVFEQDSLETDEEENDYAIRGDFVNSVNPPKIKKKYRSEHEKLKDGLTTDFPVSRTRYGKR